MVSWGILQREENHYLPTNAYWLLTGNETLFPNAIVRCAVFKGTVRNIFLDKRDYDGPIDEQIDQAVKFVLQNIPVGSRIAGVQRQDFFELPPSAIREIIANAVCHRSYVASGKIQVALFDDRLEVTSPGRLKDDLSIELMKRGNSSTRNKAIALAFSYMHIIEEWGTGVPRILRDAKEYGLKEPSFVEFGLNLRVSLYRKPFKTDRYGVVDPTTHDTPHDTPHEVTCQKILGYCVEPRTFQQIAMMLGLKDRTNIRQYIGSLMGRNLLKMTLPDKPKSKNQKYVAVQKTVS